MATIYLFHPTHGVKVATMEMEAQYDEMNGWSRFEPEALTPDEPVEEYLDAPPSDDEPEAVARKPRGRGRPRATAVV